ncbi:MAG: dipeptidase PepV [Synergistaceae bacterium]|nr:dipeptidase PepV [Synergistaceae bacterium]MBP9625651.1 dipeptidase PepV [Synergistaceae bacterium]MBP9958085.1 dipeptidase PepV [Synergistaceae bacterium]
MQWLQEAEKRKDEMVQSLCQWLKINSVYDSTTVGEGAPFGRGVKEALEYIVDLAEKDGFAAVNDEGYACHIDYGQGDKIVGILGHVDLVPEGDGWKYPPYSATVADGRIYSRGTQDDKGPMMAAYFAVKIIRDLGLPISKKIRLILGGNEERDWLCVDHYFKKYPRPDCGFTPDGSFPLIFAEKEIQMYAFTGKHSSDSIISLKGGTAPNSVPDKAVAVIKPGEGIKEAFDTYLQDHKLKGSCVEKPEGLELHVTGIGAHGSTPEVGVNAVVHLMKFLKAQTGDAMISHFADVLGGYNGEGLGIDFESKISGKLTANLGIASYEDGAYRFVLDSRYPMEVDIPKMKASIRAKTTGLPWESNMEETGFKKGIFVDLDSHLVKTLLKAYVDHTKDTESKPLAIGGGTYARATENVVCFGMAFPHTEPLAHQKNENVVIDELVLATAIYAQAIYELAK